MFHNYCKLLEFVSISFGLSVKNIRWPINNLRVYVGEGNNKNMIINILKRRNWWIIVPNIEDAHFVWTQTRNFKFLKTLFEFKKTLLLN